LKYLNLSGNKRLEIKASRNDHNSVREKSITDFSQLTKLRVLGLMDVTLTIANIPDGTEDRRVRLSGSMIRSMSYGMADSLGRNEHLSLVDMVVPDFRGSRDEWLVGLFDGQALSTGGSKISKFLHESVEFFLKDELGKLRPEETPVTALRRAFLNLNKELATAAAQTLDEKGVGTASRHLSAGGNANSGAMLGPGDLASGGVATVVYMAKSKLYVANVGDAMAVLSRTDGTFQTLTKKHDPGSISELERIREAGGWVSRTGKLNDVLDTSRAFGYFHLMPAVNAAPDIQETALEGHEEMLILASKELWEFISLQSAVDIARTEKADLMRAAHKLRDMAIGYGATNKIMVMVLGVGDMKKPRRFPRAHSMSLGPNFADEDFPTVKVTRKRGKEPDNSVGLFFTRAMGMLAKESSNSIDTEVKSGHLMAISRWSSQISKARPLCGKHILLLCGPESAFTTTLCVDSSGRLVGMKLRRKAMLSWSVSPRLHRHCCGALMFSRTSWSKNGQMKSWNLKMDGKSKIRREKSSTRVCLSGWVCIGVHLCVSRILSLVVWIILGPLSTALPVSVLRRTAGRSPSVPTLLVR